MTKSDRQNAIRELINNHGFLTVDYISKKLNFSHATINRDLNELDQQGGIKRVWGGVEATSDDIVPLLLRYEHNKQSKMIIAKAAASLIKDGDTVIIDGTTTTQYIGHYILKKKGLHIITNNLALASFLSERNMWVTVIGGDIVEKPCMTDGTEAIEMLSHYHADISFFSTSSIRSDGLIGDQETAFCSMHREMIRRSNRCYYLVDHEKLNKPINFVVCELGNIRGIISDFAFPTSLREKYSHVRFINARPNSHTDIEEKPI